jgi:hypothetical protein
MRRAGGVSSENRAITYCRADFPNTSDEQACNRYYRTVRELKMNEKAVILLVLGMVLVGMGTHRRVGWS